VFATALSIRPSYICTHSSETRFINPNEQQVFDDKGRCPAIRFALESSLMSVKDQVLQLIHRLPDDIDYRDVSEEIAFLAAIKDAELDIEQGRLVSNQQMRERIAAWTVS